MDDGLDITPTRATRRAVAEAFGVSEVALIGRKRGGITMRARIVCYYVLHKRYPRLSTPQIGRIMGGRDHSTVLNGIARCKALIERDPDMAPVIDQLISGGRGVPHDSHVWRWKTEMQFRRLQWLAALRAKADAPVLPPPVPEGLAEFAIPGKAHCSQCDRAVSVAEAQRCQQRFCAGQGRMQVAA